MRQLPVSSDLDRLPRLPRRVRRQLGVGLIEVLVAVLILSVGLLGISLVQMRALTNNGSAMNRSMAVVASYSILDAMRADRSNAVSTLLPYNTILSADDCPATDGTFAKVQLRQWCLDLGSRLGVLPTTVGSVQCGVSGVCTITVQFDDSRADAVSGNTDNQQSVTVRGAL